MTRPVVILTTLLGALLSVAPPTTSQVSDPIPTDDGVPRTVAPIEEIELLVRQPGGTTVGMTFKELVEKTMGGPLGRADLHIHRAADGELFLSSRQDGWIRTLTAANPPAPSSAQR